jgi:hypothetical protein
MNTDVQTELNWNRLTAEWYEVAAVITPGDRFAQGNLELDWPYYYNFNSSQGALRPAIYMYSMPSMFEFQSTMGWPLPYNSGIGAIMTLHPTNLMFPFGFITIGSNGTNAFASVADEKALAQAMADGLLAVTALFTMEEWEPFLTNGGSACPLSRTPSALLAYAFGGCASDGLAMGLAYFTYYEVPSGTIDALVTWGNTMFAASGHDFEDDAEATCELMGVPESLICSNF